MRKRVVGAVGALCCVLALGGCAGTPTDARLASSGLAFAQEVGGEYRALLADPGATVQLTENQRQIRINRIDAQIALMREAANSAK